MCFLMFQTRDASEQATTKKKGTSSKITKQWSLVGVSAASTPCFLTYFGIFPKYRRTSDLLCIAIPAIPTWLESLRNSEAWRHKMEAEASRCSCFPVGEEGEGGSSSWGSSAGSSKREEEALHKVLAGWAGWQWKREAWLGCEGSSLPLTLV